jgi:hypothetical protein
MDNVCKLDKPDTKYWYCTVPVFSISFVFSPVEGFSVSGTQVDPFRAQAAGMSHAWMYTRVQVGEVLTQFF